LFTKTKGYSQNQERRDLHESKKENKAVGVLIVAAVADE
jgi:hypothetical protein